MPAFLPGDAVQTAGSGRPLLTQPSKIQHASIGPCRRCESATRLTHAKLHGADAGGERVVRRPLENETTWRGKTSGATPNEVIVAGATAGRDPRAEGCSLLLNTKAERGK